jgi:hypothetical protein
MTSDPLSLACQPPPARAQGEGSRDRGLPHSDMQTSESRAGADIAVTRRAPLRKVKQTVASWMSHVRKLR